MRGKGVWKVDKAEYRERLDEINELQEDGRFEEAAELADEIDWRKVKSVRTLSMIGGIYNEVRRYDDARRIMKLAYRRSSASKTVLCCLAELAIREGDFDEARRYISEFEDNSPNDTSRFILRYKLLRAQKEPLDDQIAVLREYKDNEYTERWAYELARLYKKNGQNERCVEECDDMILWFSEGKYVYKAMELKQTITPLTPSQQAKYDAAKKAAEEARQKAAEEAERAALEAAEKEASAAEEQEEEPAEGSEEGPAEEPAGETDIPKEDTDADEEEEAGQDEEAEEESPVSEAEESDPGFLTDILAEEAEYAGEPAEEEKEVPEKRSRKLFGRKARKEEDESEERERMQRLLEEDEDEEESVPRVKTGEAIAKMDNAAEETVLGAARDEDEQPMRVRRRGRSGSGEKLQTRILNSFRAVFAGFRAQNTDEEEEEEEFPVPEDAAEAAAAETEETAAEEVQALPSEELVPELEPESGSAISIIAQEAEKDEDVLPEEEEAPAEEPEEARSAESSWEEDPETAGIDEAVRDTADPYAELNLEELFAETGNALAEEVASGQYEMADRLKGDEEEDAAPENLMEEAGLLKKAIEEIDHKEKTIEEVLAEEEEIPEEEETLKTRMMDTAVHSETGDDSLEEEVPEDAEPLRETDESLGLTRTFNFREEIDRALFGDSEETSEESPDAEETPEESPAAEEIPEEGPAVEEAFEESSAVEEETSEEDEESRTELPPGAGAAATEGIASESYGYAGTAESGAEEETILSDGITTAPADEETELSEDLLMAEEPEESPEEAVPETPEISLEEAAAIGVSEAERLREEAIEKAEQLRREERARALAEAQAEAEAEAARLEEEARIRALEREAEERETQLGLLEAIRSQSSGTGTAEKAQEEISYSDAELDELVMGLTDEDFIRSLSDDEAEEPEEEEAVPEIPKEDVEIYRASEEEEGSLGESDFTEIPEETEEEGLTFSDLEGEDDNEELVRQILDEPDVFTRMEVEGRDLTDAEKKALGYFAAIPGIGHQTTAAVADVYNNCGDKTSRSGNIIITGRQGSGKTRLADGLIRMICMNINIQAAKVAKVVADTFNTKDPAAVVKKLSGGFLLIEAAGSLTDETIVKLNRAMDFRTDDLIVILEDEKQDMDPMLARHPEFAAKFTSTITVPIFTNDELVTFARTYAQEEGYKLDDMATLALYTMIGENQKDTEPVTVGRVREMVDRAIDRNSRRFRFGRNSDKNKDQGLTVLHEKDFS